jgi:hypothetical protein
MITMRQTRRAALWCAAASFLACAGDRAGVGTGDGSDVAGPAYSGPLCPSCLAGGETGDFTGGGARTPNGCPQRSIAADAELVLPSGLSARAAIDLVQREVQLPATWRDMLVSHVFAGHVRESSGFSPQTDVTLDIQVTGVSRLEFIDDAEHPFSPATQAACDGIDLTAEVSVTTGDGSITGTFATVVHVYSETEAALLVEGDISQFTGSLQLGAREGESLRAMLAVSFDGERVRGALLPIVRSPQQSADAPEDGLPPEYGPLELHWPDTDSCNFYSFPYTGDAARERGEPVVAQLRGSYTGVYLEPTYDVGSPRTLGTTQMTVEVASPSLVCQGRLDFGRSPLQSQQLVFPARFVSSDGRYDLTVSLDAYVEVRPEEPFYAFAGPSEFKSGPLPIDEFQTRFGIGPLSFGDAECASLSVLYYLQSSSEYGRLFQVEAGRCGTGTGLVDARVVELLGTE